MLVPKRVKHRKVQRGKMRGEAKVPEEVAREALRLAGTKLPVRTKIVKREEVGGQSNED